VTRIRLERIFTRVDRRVPVVETQSYRFVGVRSFAGGCFDAGEKLGSETRYSTLNAVVTGDFVYPKLMAWEGAFARVPEAFDGWVVSPEFCTFVIDTSTADPLYVDYFFRRPESWEEVAGRSIGTNVRRRRLYPDDFLAKEIRLPDIAEQRRIAARLERVLDVVKRLEEAQGRTSRNVLIPLFPLIVDLVLEEAPREPRRIGDLVDVVPEVMKPGELPGPAQAFVGLQHIESHTGRRIGSLPLGSEKGDKRRFQSGDIVYGNLRPYLNKVWFADLDGVCSVDQRVLRPRAGVDGELLAYAIRSRSLLDQAIARTAALQLPRVRMRDFLEFEVPVVKSPGDEPVRERLTRTLGWAQQLVDLRATQKEKAAALGVSVLNRAFSGRL